MVSRTPTYQGEPGLCKSLGPLEEPSLDGEGSEQLQQEGCHERCLQHRLGGAVRRQTGFWPLVKSRKRLPHQLLGDASSMSSLTVLPARPNKVPCADLLGKHVRGVLYKLNQEADMLSRSNVNSEDWMLHSQVIGRIKKQRHKVLLVASLWKKQPWLSELTQLLVPAPWPVLLRWDLHSQANGTIWHPRPELWALHVFPLNRSLPASQSEC